MLRIWTALVTIVLPVTLAQAQVADKVRGTVTFVSETAAHVTAKDGRDDVVSLLPNTRFTYVEWAKLSDVKPGSFIGTAATTADDGTLVAVEVHVFPESMRGAGEGHRPFDLGPKSTMTNGTVGNEVVGNSGQALSVRYAGGEKTIVVRPDTPVVTFAPADRAALIPGAHVVIFGQPSGGSLTAANVLIGRDGLVPPM